MQPETRFKLKVRPILEAIENSWWVKIEQRSVRGIPDFQGVVNGRFVALELKVGKNKTDKLQDYTLERIRRAGGLAFVLTPDNLDAVIQQIKEETHVFFKQKEPRSSGDAATTKGRSKVRRRT